MALNRFLGSAWGKRNDFELSAVPTRSASNARRQGLRMDSQVRSFAACRILDCARGLYDRGTVVRG